MLCDIVFGATRAMVAWRCLHASHQALILHSPVAHPAREARGLKRHGVVEGEGGLGQIYFALPRYL
jgi:hypothetical protein